MICRPPKFIQKERRIPSFSSINMKSEIAAAAAKSIAEEIDKAIIQILIDDIKQKNLLKSPPRFIFKRFQNQSGGSDGEIVFNTTDDTLYVFQHRNWKPIIPSQWSHNEPTFCKTVNFS